MTRVLPGVSKRISPPCFVLIQSIMGRFSFSSQFGPSCCSVHGREIILLATMQQTTMRCPAWDEKENFPTTLQVMREHGGEILLLASGWTSLMVVRRMVGRCPTMRQTTMKMSNLGQVRESPPACSVDVIQSVVRRFLTCPRLVISPRHLAQGGE